MREEITEGQNFPWPTALNFSHKVVEGLLVGRSSATSGPKEIQDYNTSPNDTYEWEFSGVRIAANSSFYDEELGMISVITFIYGLLSLNSQWVIQAFAKLAKYLENFIESSRLALQVVIVCFKKCENYLWCVVIQDFIQVFGWFCVCRMIHEK